MPLLYPVKAGLQRSHQRLVNMCTGEAIHRTHKIENFQSAKYAPDLFRWSHGRLVRQRVAAGAATFSTSIK